MAQSNIEILKNIENNQFEINKLKEDLKNLNNNLSQLKEETNRLGLKPNKLKKLAKIFMISSSPLLVCSIVLSFLISPLIFSSIACLGFIGFASGTATLSKSYSLKEYEKIKMINLNEEIEFINGDIFQKNRYIKQLEEENNKLNDLLHNLEIKKYAENNIENNFISSVKTKKDELTL